MSRPGTDKSPLVSVIIPTYNSGRFVAQAVESVLTQTYSPIEVIVVDDGSTDDTKSVLSRFNGQIRYICQPNSGPSAARNTGIRIAEGEYISFLDADDLWVPDKLALQTAFMQKSPNIGLLFSDHEEFDEAGIVFPSFLDKKKLRLQLVSQTPIQGIFAKLLEENFISTPTVMVRKECFEKAGLFDEAVRSVEDLDLWLRISTSFEIFCLPQVVCRRRIHAFNTSRDRAVSDPGLVMVFENNWRRFADFAPAEVWNRQIANSNLYYGYTLLSDDRRLDALRAGFKSIRHALSHAARTRSFASYSWMFGIGLIVAPLLGWKTARSFWRTVKHSAFRFTKQPS